MSPDEGLVAYFGYGSLVNRATHRTEIVDAMPARLLGWRRSWCPPPTISAASMALLSVRRMAGAGCDGLLVIDRAGNLAAVDRREARYRRVTLDPSEIECRGVLPDCEIYVYEVAAEPPAVENPPAILRSYLDAVMQGFRVEHGETGLNRFVEETNGFHLHIHDDRAQPRYPRAVRIESHEAELFEAALARRAGRMRPPDPTQASSSNVMMETSPSSAP